MCRQRMDSRAERAIEQGKAGWSSLPAGRPQAGVSTLRRGYAIVLDGDTPVTSVDMASQHMTVMLRQRGGVNTCADKGGSFAEQ